MDYRYHPSSPSYHYQNQNQNPPINHQNQQYQTSPYQNQQNQTQTQNEYEPPSFDNHPSYHHYNQPSPQPQKPPFVNFNQFPTNPLYEEPPILGQSHHQSPSSNYNPLYQYQPPLVQNCLNRNQHPSPLQNYQNQNQYPPPPTNYNYRYQQPINHNYRQPPQSNYHYSQPPPNNRYQRPCSNFNQFSRNRVYQEPYHEPYQESYQDPPSFTQYHNQSSSNQFSQVPFQMQDDSFYQDEESEMGYKLAIILETIQQNNKDLSKSWDEFFRVQDESRRIGEAIVELQMQASQLREAQVESAPEEFLIQPEQNMVQVNAIHLQNEKVTSSTTNVEESSQKFNGDAPIIEDVGSDTDREELKEYARIEEEDKKMKKSEQEKRKFDEEKRRIEEELMKKKKLEEKERKIKLKDDLNIKKPNIKEPVAIPPKPPDKAYVPPIPFPNRLKKQKDKTIYNQFIKTIGGLKVNLPFAEALSQLPIYLKFLKDAISSKSKIDEFATVVLTHECSAIVTNKIPQKLQDPGSFTIPMEMGNSLNIRGLCDLGSSINLMPLSIFRKLGEVELQPTQISLQLADRSTKRPLGIVENILVKVNHLYFPVDFVILDMKEDADVPIILGRPFLATSGALIDVRGGKLKLRVETEEAEFDMFQTVKEREKDEKVFKVEESKDVNEKLGESNHEETKVKDVVVKGTKTRKKCDKVKWDDSRGCRVKMKDKRNRRRTRVVKRLSFKADVEPD